MFTISGDFEEFIVMHILMELYNQYKKDYILMLTLFKLNFSKNIMFMR